MKILNIIIYVFVIICLVLLVNIHGNLAQGDLIHSCPPVVGEVLLLGDHLYFLHEVGILAKHSKYDLSEEDTLNYNKCYNIIYSCYLDVLIAHAGFNPSKIIFIDYANMTIIDEFEYEMEIGGISADDDKLYVISDASGIEFGEYYGMSELPNNTGVLSEIGLDDMLVNWQVNIGTMPCFVITAGNYIATMSYETAFDETRQMGSIVNIVDKYTHEVRQFIAGPGTDPHIEYDGISKIYISNPNGATDPETGEWAGITIINTDTWEVDHVLLEGNPHLEGKIWKAQGSCISGDYLYIAYFNSKYNGKTYFGKYNTNTGYLENIELPGISQFLMFTEVDGDNIYFSTTDAWLIKYTFD